MPSVSIRHLDAQQRAGIYIFLADVLGAAPTSDSVWALTQLAASLEVPLSKEPALVELEREYEELFVVPNPRYVAPFESVFRQSPETSPRPGIQRPIQGVQQKAVVVETVLDVEKCYRSAGLTANRKGPDHIGNELRFMAYLWWRQDSSTPVEARRLATIRATFRQKHLLGWIGELTQKVAESDRSGYYYAAFRVAETVIREDS